MKHYIYATLVLLLAAHVSVTNAVANPAQAIESLGCKITSVDAQGKVSVECSESVLESSVGASNKCEPVMGKPGPLL